MREVVGGWRSGEAGRWGFTLGDGYGPARWVSASVQTNLLYSVYVSQLKPLPSGSQSSTQAVIPLRPAPTQRGKPARAEVGITSAPGVNSATASSPLLVISTGGESLARSGNLGQHTSGPCRRVLCQLESGARTCELLRPRRLLWPGLMQGKPARGGPRDPTNEDGGKTEPDLQTGIKEVTVCC